jgi:hypothetical protein
LVVTDACEHRAQHGLELVELRQRVHGRTSGVRRSGVIVAQMVGGEPSRLSVATEHEEPAHLVRPRRVGPIAVDHASHHAGDRTRGHRPYHASSARLRGRAWVDRRIGPGRPDLRIARFGRCGRAARIAR